MKNQDDAILNLTNYAQSTHNEVYVNSVATAILKLQKNYLSESPSEDDFNKAYADCLTTLKNLTVEDFFKRDDPRDPVLVKEISDNLPEMINFIIAMTEAPINPQLDIVRLHGHTTPILLDLKHILPLFILAYKDDAKFTKEYLGNDVDKLKQAREDRPLRLLSFFRCLQQLKGTYNVGIRNALLALLNKTYDGIDLIFDARTTVEFFLKQDIIAILDSKLQDTNDIEKHKILCNALFKWMQSSNAGEFLNEIAPENEIKQNLLNYFLEHGTDPEQSTVKYGEAHFYVPQFIDKLLLDLPYPRDAKNHLTFAMCDVLLKSYNPYPESEKCNAALTKVQNWILTNINGNTAQPAFAEFYSVYQSHLKLLEYKSLLLVCGRIEDDTINTFIQQANNYYEEVSSADNNVLPLPSQSILILANQLNDSIELSKKDNLYDTIQNFFGMWFSGDAKTLSRLYLLLIDEKSQSKILLSDTKLDKWNEENQDGHFIDRTPYATNRIFLHAIITEPTNPGQWTPKFAHELNEILQLINKPEQDNYLNHSLKQTSYPPQLIKQLEYLYSISQGQDKARPNDMIVLPNQIKTAQEWLSVSELLDIDTRKKIYQSFRIKIEGILINNIISNTQNKDDSYLSLLLLLMNPKNKDDSLYETLQSIPPDDWKTFITNLFARIYINSITAEEMSSTLLDFINQPDDWQKNVSSLVPLLRSNDELLQQFAVCILVANHDNISNISDAIREANIIPLLVAILRSTNTDTKEKILAVLLFLIENNLDALDDVYKANFIEELIMLLESIHDDIQTLAGSLLVVLVHANITRNTDIVEAKDIEALIKSLQSTNKTVQKIALKYLKSLVQYDKIKNAIREAKGIQPVIKLLQSTNKEIQELALSNLEELIIPDDTINKSSVRNAEGIKRLFELLTSTNTDIIISVTETLVDLLEDHYVDYYILLSTESQTSVIRRLVTLLESQNTDIIRSTIIILIFLMHDNRGNQRDVREANGITPLIELLQSNNVEIQEFVPLALLELISNNTDNKNAVCAANVIEPLTQLLNSNNENVRKSAQDLYELISRPTRVNDELEINEVNQSITFENFSVVDSDSLSISSSSSYVSEEELPSSEVHEPLLSTNEKKYLETCATVELMIGAFSDDSIKSQYARKSFLEKHPEIAARHFLPNWIIAKSQNAKYYLPINPDISKADSLDEILKYSGFTGWLKRREYLLKNSKFLTKKHMLPPFLAALWIDEKYYDLTPSQSSSKPESLTTNSTCLHEALKVQRKEDYLNDEEYKGDSSYTPIFIVKKSNEINISAQVQGIALK